MNEYFANFTMSSHKVSTCSFVQPLSCSPCFNSGSTFAISSTFFFAVAFRISSGLRSLASLPISISCSWNTKIPYVTLRIGCKSGWIYVVGSLPSFRAANSGILSILPGRNKAFASASSSRVSHFICLRESFIPWLSNWKIQLVLPLRNSSHTSLSDILILCGAI